MNDRFLSFLLFSAVLHAVILTTCSTTPPHADLRAAPLSVDVVFDEVEAPVVEPEPEPEPEPLPLEPIEAPDTPPPEPEALTLASPPAPTVDLPPASFVDSPTEPLSGNLPPVYPWAARRARYEGIVLLGVEVATDGTVSGITIDQSSGHAILDREARRAVQQWRFTPAKTLGSPVASRIAIPVRFVLKE